MNLIDLTLEVWAMAKKGSTRAVDGAPDDWWLTTEQVMAKTGKTRPALFAWVHRGFISGPTVTKVPVGRGRRAMWSRQVVDEVKVLDALAERGVPLQVAHQQIMMQGASNSSLRYDETYHLAQLWGAPGTAGVLAKQLGLQDVEASLRECFVYALCRLAHVAGLSEQSIERVSWAASEHLVPALMAFIGGTDPVLVVGADGAFVAPRLALGAVYSPSPNADPDEWVGLAADEFVAPAPHEQWPGRRWLPAFAVLDLGPVMRRLWRQWGKSPGAAFGEIALHYEYAPVVWQRVGDQYLENDALLVPWGRRPFALMLDISPNSARPVPKTVPQLAAAEAQERWEREAPLRQAELATAWASPGSAAHRAAMKHEEQLRARLQRSEASPATSTKRPPSRRKK
jgi:hypothetical protein